MDCAGRWHCVPLRPLGLHFSFDGSLAGLQNRGGLKYDKKCVDLQRVVRTFIDFMGSPGPGHSSRKVESRRRKREPKMAGATVRNQRLTLFINSKQFVWGAKVCFLVK